MLNEDEARADAACGICGHPTSDCYHPECQACGEVLDDDEEKAASPYCPECQRAGEGEDDND